MTERRASYLLPQAETAENRMKPHLQTVARSLGQDVPTFLTRLAAYLETPGDETGARLNLLTQAQELRGMFDQLAGLLGQVEASRIKTDAPNDAPNQVRDEPQADDGDREWWER